MDLLDLYVLPLGGSVTAVSLHSSLPRQLSFCRELCQQIYHEARKFGRAYNLTVCCVYGGGSRWEQSKALKEGCEVLVATPGRLIDLIKAKATNLLRVTYLVFDEADKMFDMGFETQVSISCVL